MYKYFHFSLSFYTGVPAPTSNPTQNSTLISTRHAMPCHATYYSRTSSAVKPAVCVILKYSSSESVPKRRDDIQREREREKKLTRNGFLASVLVDSVVCFPYTWRDIISSSSVTVSQLHAEPCLACIGSTVLVTLNSSVSVYTNQPTD